ncbi:hypothetical protein PUNSTDRAFT_85042 [Punctularia strigosozonata HHB-11173 SS5]|uniref:uncharacterized protein n=1 Tax=Punctularia strigosozonata (strain HHB-11173) TaxID=741275 RepID=UPI0004418389|nr:uncharacterized protein PUNSTDRAFT_85042 [Punctularia strigosozonata HHB-11173 SS5]EIN10747.1 hypothetical protein PUNSTDRAFT_85042 [Punctularia strigosozonata HHB-11173 SS5]
MSAFSRLQLAAALIEYDNDPDNPGAGRSAHDSAIFAHLRRNAPRPTPSRRSTDYLGVALPGETGGSAGDPEETDLPYRRSTPSVNALVNPFRQEESEEEADEEEENVDVDLASWGLDAFIPKDKEKGKSSKSRPRRKSENLDSLPVHKELQAGMQRASPRMRSMSMGNFDQFGLDGAFLEAGSMGGRPKSIASPLEFVDVPSTIRPPHPRRASSQHALIDKIPTADPLLSVPFPRSGTPAGDDATVSRPLSRGSFFAPRPGHERTYSTASFGSQALLSGDGRDRRQSVASLGSKMLLDEGEPNPFAVRPPSPERASRFDPKARNRALSISSRDLLADENNSFSVPLPSPSRTSRFDPKGAARARTMSNGSLGSRMLLDDAASYTSNALDRPYSKLELMRPKVLVMPSPLQTTEPPPKPSPYAREGFQLSTEGPPLPAAARANRRASAVLSTIQPSGSLPAASATNPFVPNPRASMTLSQLTFRSALSLAGQRDGASADMDLPLPLPRAAAEGEQAHFEDPVEPELLPEPVITVEVDEPQTDPRARPPGKLFGKSLIDDLEERKANMRAKQRVFRGDDRPSMMARQQRSSTLIDPSSFQQRPVSQRMSSFHSQGTMDNRLSRRNSKTLLNFDDDGPQRSPVSPGTLSTDNQMSKSRSVFGVDTLWEREMAKLKEIEAKEKAEAAEREKREEAEEANASSKKGKKGKSKDKGKGKAKAEADTPSVSPTINVDPSPPRVSAEPPRLPEVAKAITRGPPPPGLDDSESSNSDVEGEPSVAAISGRNQVLNEAWGSSDEEDRVPRRTSGVGPRHPSTHKPPAQALHEIDSDEDVPLAATVQHARQRYITSGGPLQDDSDEEKPLAVLVEKVKLGVPSIDFDKPLLSTSSKAGEDDEDDQPLGLRASRASMLRSPSNAGPVEDDDVPLGLRPEQQRRTQYQMLAAQQQQMMMLQAQMTGGMYFGPPPLGPAPPMLGSPFFGPPVPSPMMMMGPPPQLPSPPPIQDTAKLNRVDKWRHDVAVEGEPV